MEELKSKIKYIEKCNAKILETAIPRIVNGELVMEMPERDDLPLSQMVLLMRNETEIKRTKKEIKALANE